MATVATMPPQDVFDAVPTDDLSWRAAWASKAIKKNLVEIEKEAKDVPTEDPKGLFPAKDSTFIGDARETPFRVGIIGAGAAGLFTAMIFDHLKEQFGLDVEYEILEADDRVGGRLYSHYFKQTDPKYPVGPHDYFDVGAMRFPEIDIMKRTFELFQTLGMTKEKQKPPAKVEKGSLVPYYFAGAGQPSYFNGVQKIIPKGSDVTADTFGITGLPKDKSNADAGKLVDRTIEPYREEYKKNGAKAFWKKLLGEADLYTVRQYMALKENYDYNTIEFLECMESGNRWYDQAFSECVIDAMEFDTSADWWCVEGGAAEITQRMHSKLKRSDAVELSKVVRAISYVDGKRRRVEVTVEGETTKREYDAVFNSASLGAMQRMELEGLYLNWGTKQAIRSLGYGASCKVGVRFKNLWWFKEGITLGGQGKTDLPIGCCVYPSYNVHDDASKPGVLLVSYTWSQQASRFGALIHRESPDKEEQLKQVLIHDLARLHAKSGDEADYKRLHDIISESYLTHYGYDWYSNPRTSGAFAYFGPQQFDNMYPWVVRNNGKHIIIGEAASAHHAWVVGSLESAVRGVYQFVHKHSLHDKAAFRAAKAYEYPDSTGGVKGPFGPLPAEYDWTTDFTPPPGANIPKEDMPSPYGCLARLGVTFENIRLREDEPKDMVDPSTVTWEKIKDRLVFGDLANKPIAVAA